MESPQYSWGVGANYLHFHGTQVSIIREESPFLQYSMELYLASSSLMVGVVNTVSCQPSIHFLFWKKEREEGRTENEKKGQRVRACASEQLVCSIDGEPLVTDHEHLYASYGSRNRTKLVRDVTAV